MKKQKIKLIRKSFLSSFSFNCKTNALRMGINDHKINSVEDAEILIDCKLKRDK